MFEIGASLREARARQGAGFDEMEQRTKIRAKYLRFLEDERFDQLPGPTYTKGFLRVYANALGLDGQLYVDEFNSRFVIGDDEHPPRPRRVQPARQRRQQRRESRVLVGVVASIAVITSLVIAAWRFGGAETPSVRGLDQSAPGVVSTTSQRITLEIRAVGGASYVEVWSGSGDAADRRQLYAGTLERGQAQRFVDSRLMLAIRTPKHVALKINGNRYPGRGEPVPRELDIAAATTGRG